MEPPLDDEAAAQPQDPAAPDGQSGQPHADAGAASAEKAPASPQFGGAAASDATRIDEANAHADDPGYVSAKPLLTTGDYGHDVAYLAHLLAAAGHPNAVAAGLSEPVLNDELMRIVREFQDANGIDPTKSQSVVDLSKVGDAPPLVRKDHEGIVEAATWAALLEAAGQNVDAELKINLRYPKGAFA